MNFQYIRRESVMSAIHTLRIETIYSTYMLQTSKKQKSGVQYKDCGASRTFDPLPKNCDMFLYISFIDKTFHHFDFHFFYPLKFR